MLLFILSSYISYVLQNRNTLIHGQETNDPPIISVMPSKIVAGDNVTIRCEQTMHSQKVLLYKNGKPFLEQQSDGQAVEFHITNIKLKDQTNYFCMRKSDSRLSDSIYIKVQGKPQNSTTNNVPLDITTKNEDYIWIFSTTLVDPSSSDPFTVSYYPENNGTITQDVDYTTINIIRVTIAAVLFLFIIAVLMEYFCYNKRKKKQKFEATQELYLEDRYIYS
ncbi:uncharacterized protein LOC128638079 [Bombina bombina]|uniref:uncharacterized protein LOC128638079 n=1 Tax=Bombina bombina TaxID=8345 RepID=UPI00235A99C5|nr:uncharacterized protein LOC128638079 [Bombina bombina]